MSGDPFNLQRFVDAHAGGVYEQALSEIRAGEKRSHWIWFIFPQHRDLGRSPTAKYYGLSGEEEARAYLAHPVLGPATASASRRCGRRWMRAVQLTLTSFRQAQDRLV